MASSYTTRKRLNKQGTGDGTSTWGATLNSGVFDVLDFALDGWTTLAIAGDHTLSTADGTTTANEAGARCLKLTTATSTYTQTLPAREAWYLVWNATTVAQTIASAGAGTSVSIGAGEIVPIMTDGTNVKRLTLTTMTTALDMGSHKITSVTDPTSNQDAATKKYVDDTAFNMAAGALPGQGGNSGKILTTNGTTASWDTTFTNLTLTTPAISAPTITGGSTLSGGETFTGSTKQNVVAMTALDIDVGAGEFFTKAISTNSTFTISNATASKAQAFALKLTISSAAVPTWPAAVKWATGVAPTLGNGTHVLGFITFDGGTTWTGVLAAFNQS